MNPTLLSKLKSINPTEGEWRTYTTESYIRVVTDEPRNIDDRKLITLAPCHASGVVEDREAIHHANR